MGGRARAVAHPEVSGSQLAGQGRVVRMVKLPPPGLLGVQLVSAAGMPCVTVTAIDSESATAAGLLVGDVVLAMRCLAQTEAGKRATTVLRSAAVANRAFGHASGELELRLAHYNREVKLTKVGGVAGVAVAPSSTAKRAAAARRTSPASRSSPSPTARASPPASTSATTSSA